MAEFDEPGKVPDLSMDLSVENFQLALFATTERLSDELAYVVYQECLEESENYDPEDTDMKFKRGLLLKTSGEVEERRGDYADAVTSYRKARAEITEFDEHYSLELFIGEAHLLMHELQDPEASIEPYEAGVRIFENKFTGSGADQNAPHEMFISYRRVLNHLAVAYQHAGDRDKVLQVGKKINALGGIPAAVFGIDICDHAIEQSDETSIVHENTPLYNEILEKLTAPLPVQDPEKEVEGLQSLERLVDSDAFLPDAPEQRDHILLQIYGRYGMLVPDLKEREVFILKALKIAKKLELLVPKTQLYISLANNQASLERPIDEQQWTLKKALSAAEDSMDAGVSAEGASLEVIAELLITQLAAQRDFIGIEKIQRRLRTRGLEVRSTMPGAMRPELN
jgi:tetratricopeptide (TPR) repeat protein